jgi:hypothetical protein
MLSTRLSNSQSVERAACALATASNYMGIDHGGRHIGVPEQILHRADIGARLQQMGGKGVA